MFQLFPGHCILHLCQVVMGFIPPACLTGRYEKPLPFTNPGTGHQRHHIKPPLQGSGFRIPSGL